MPATDNRPFFLNLVKIRLPVTGFVSILHRVSGLLMFLATPYAIYLFDLSLQGASGFDQAVIHFENPVVKLGALIILWSVIHHLLAGIRFLLTDFDIGIDKDPANRYAWLVFILEAIIVAGFMMEILL